MATPPKIFLIDSAAQVSAEMRDHIVVTGSHGGISAAKFVLPHAPLLCIFNDAGIGLDRAGVAGLALLAEHGIAAATVSHLSARIGEAQSSLATGIISELNAPARALGLTLEARCETAIAFFTQQSSRAS